MCNFSDLKGKHIVVTGASSGIGRETCIVLSRLGAKVVLIARNEVELKNTLEYMEGDEHTYYLLDLGMVENIEGVVRQIVADIGPVDGLVYCAGIASDKPMNLLKYELLDSILKVNLMGFVEICRCFSKKRFFNSGMSIVGISSVASLKGSKGHVAYSASKAGMDGAMRCMAIELAKKQIRVNNIAPANVMTPLIKGWLEDIGGEESDTYKNIVSKQYLGMGEPADIANTVAFLLSNTSKFITGQCIPVDGGYTSN